MVALSLDVPTQLGIPAPRGVRPALGDQPSRAAGKHVAPCSSPESHIRCELTRC